MLGAVPILPIPDEQPKISYRAPNPKWTPLSKLYNVYLNKKFDSISKVTTSLWTDDSLSPLARSCVDLFFSGHHFHFRREFFRRQEKSTRKNDNLRHNEQLQRDAWRLSFWDDYV